MFLRVAIFFTLILSLPTMVGASSVVRTGENISIASDQAVEGDFYGAGNNVIVSGEVLGDLIVAGMNVKLNGNLGSDLAALAGALDIHGVVGDDVRIIAGEVTVGGEIKGDLVVIASSLEVLSTAKISGDLIFFGSSAVISGEVGKSVFGQSEKMRIDGEVLGDVDIKTTGLVLGERAKVDGMVKYSSLNEMVRAQNARVAGKIVKNDPVFDKTNSFREILVPILVTLFAALVWFLFFRRLLDKVASHSNNHFVRSAFLGFGVLFLFPIGITILIVSSLGSLLGVTLLFIYIALILISLSLAGIVAGSYMAKIITKSHLVTIPYILAGTIAIFVLVYIPLIGPIFLFSLFVTTLGSLTVYLYRLARSS